MVESDGVTKSFDAESSVLFQHLVDHVVEGQIACRFEDQDLVILVFGGHRVVDEPALQYFFHILIFIFKERRSCLSWLSVTGDYLLRRIISGVAKTKTPEIIPTVGIAIPDVRPKKTCQRPNAFSRLQK